MGFLVAALSICDFSERDDAAGELLIRLIVLIFHQAGPIISLNERLLASSASTRFRHIEDQKATGHEDVKRTAQRILQ